MHLVQTEPISQMMPGRNMRKQEEIIGRIRERKELDIFGFEWHEYVNALTQQSAISLSDEIFKEDADFSDWKQTLACDNDIRKTAIEYMAFAWDKANGFRGISATRSMAHYVAWLWLLGEDQFEGIEDYQFYGKDQLVRICEFLGLDASQWDDGVRFNDEPGWDDE